MKDGEDECVSGKRCGAETRTGRLGKCLKFFRLEFTHTQLQTDVFQNLNYFIVILDSIMRGC